MEDILVKGSDVIIVAILVLWVGDRITQKIQLLKKYSIPIAVTGGLLCSIIVAIIDSAGGLKISFDLATRDTLLMVFFTTIGISAKISRLKAGGKALGILVICAWWSLRTLRIAGTADKTDYQDYRRNGVCLRFDYLKGP